MLNSKALAASVSAGPAVYVEDVFSTFLYTGNGSTQTITNGIDLSGEGGLTWIKGRSGATGHRFTDTARGATKSLESNSTAGEATESTGLTSFSSTGFALGADADYSTNAATYCSWTFREQPKFFDVVTFTSNGSSSNRRVAHNLGAVPGCIIIKRLNTTGQWYVYHRSLGLNSRLFLHTTDPADSPITTFGTSNPTSTDFGFNEPSNSGAGDTFVAYLFAHDAGGFGTAGTDNVVSCGTFSGTGFVNLGWEPQWIMIKPYNQVYNWEIYDNMRGMGQPAGFSSGQVLRPNTSGAEPAGASAISFEATGFTQTSFGASYPCIYIAIRRGPMKTPTDATKVFSAQTGTGTGSTKTISSVGFSPDLFIGAARSIGYGFGFSDRLRGSTVILQPSNSAAEVDRADSITSFTMDGAIVGADSGSGNFNIGSGGGSPTYAYQFFRRAPGFFDVVAYAGSRSAFDGGSTAISHNLGATPELMIIKSRTSGSYNWSIYSTPTGNTDWLSFDAFGPSQNSNFWNNTTPTASIFTVGSSTYVNVTGQNYIAYLFASCPGVSKIGSYTGTGTTQQINCGFTAGARFILIKRVDGASGSNWYVYDTARGIVSGNDPYLWMNSTDAEVTNTDYIDPLSSGFEISSTAPAAINANGGSFIFLAIA